MKTRNPKPTRAAAETRHEVQATKNLEETRLEIEWIVDLEQRF
jgi:hypothetical protein